MLNHKFSQPNMMFRKKNTRFAFSVRRYCNSCDLVFIDGDDDDSSYYGCWLSDATRAYPVGRMLEQLDNVTRRGLSDGHFTQAQGLWQESEASIAIGALRNSSLLLDQRRSGLNEILAREVASGRWRGAVNFLEVNDVCDHGAELAKALTPDLEPQPG